MENGKTIIGETIEIEGEIEGNEDLVVRGIVHGKIISRKNLTIESFGRVEAEIDTRNLDVSGQLVGRVQASEKVEIQKEGRMTGDIDAPRVVIADGAKFRGNIDMGAEQKGGS